MRSAIALAIIVVCGLAPCRAAQADSVTSLIGEINAAGLHEFQQRKLSATQEVGVSPLTVWYLRYVADAASSDPPAQESENAAVSLIRSVDASGADVVFSRQVAVSREGTAYSSVSAAALGKAAVVQVETSSDPGRLLDVSVAFAKSYTGLLAAFLDDYNYEMLLRRLSGSDLFRASAALQIRAAFDAKLFQNSVIRRPLPYFVDGHIQAVRLDSLDGVLSCYLFTGSAQAILALKSSMDEAKWRTARSAFSIKSVYLHDLGLSGYSDDALYPGRRDAFGTQLHFLGHPASGAEALRTQLSDGHLQADAIASIAGGPNMPTTVENAHPWRPHFPLFSSDRSLLYMIEDRHSGLLLLVGGHIAGPCSYGYSTC